MTFTVQQVVDFARRRVLDTRTTHRYTDQDFIDGLNQGISTMLEMKPILFASVEPLTLAEGILQDASTIGDEFMSATRNLGVDGTTPGGAIRPVSRMALDTADPGWASATPAGEVDHVAPVVETRTQFYVYPPQPAPPHTIEVVVAVHPGVYTAVGETVAVADRYLPALANFAASFVLMADDESPATDAKAQRLYQVFVALVGPTGDPQDDG